LPAWSTIQPAPCRRWYVYKRAAVHAVFLCNLGPDKWTFQPYDSFAVRWRRCCGFRRTVRSFDMLTPWSCGRLTAGTSANGAQILYRPGFWRPGTSKWQRDRAWSAGACPHGLRRPGRTSRRAAGNVLATRCAEDNMAGLLSTTPAQYFTCFRRQSHVRVPQAARRDAAQKSCCGTMQPSHPGADCPTDLVHEVLEDAGAALARCAPRHSLPASIYYDLCEQRAQEKTPGGLVCRVSLFFYPFCRDRFSRTVKALRGRLAKSVPGCQN